MDYGLRCVWITLKWFVFLCLILPTTKKLCRLPRDRWKHTGTRQCKVPAIPFLRHFLLFYFTHYRGCESPFKWFAFLCPILPRSYVPRDGNTQVVPGYARFMLSRFKGIFSFAFLHNMIFVVPCLTCPLFALHMPHPTKELCRGIETGTRLCKVHAIPF